MTNTIGPPLSSVERRRVIIGGLLRGGAFTLLLTVLYFVSPLDRASRLPLGVVLTVGLVVLAAVTTYQVRAIVRAGHPAARAVEALAITVPLFLFLFAAIYFVLSGSGGSNFNSAMQTRIDALYFTVTVFSTVGFGDITATSQTARGLVTLQMILDLIIIGAVVRVFVAAVKLARSTTPASKTEDPNER